MKDLNECRKEIDEIDQQLIKLFEQRMKISKEVVTYKLANNMQIFQPEREKDVIEKNVKRLDDSSLQAYAHNFVQDIMDIGKSYQAFVVAAVVPAQMFLGYAQRKAVVQHAVQIFRFRFLFVLPQSHEEGGRGKLVGVAHYHRAFGARKRGDRLAGGNLRRLVENKQIEQVGPGFKILRNGGRAHHHARRRHAQKSGNFREQLAHVYPLHIAACAPFERHEFERERTFRAFGRQAGNKIFAYLRLGIEGKSLCKGGEFCRVFVHHSG